jgi:hypothetical protein
MPLARTESAVTFVTPTFGRDYERFCLQRESMERCGVELPHVAVVHDEDMAMFAQVPHRRNLTILSTRQVLGSAIDRRRRAWGVRRLNPLHWTVRRPVAGWMSQQLVKLAASEWVDTDGIAALDSDAFFIGRVTAEDFFTGGKLHLYETADNIDVQMAEWLCRSMKFLGIDPAGQPLRQYIHHPFIMHRQVLRNLHREIERRHGKPWMDAVLDGNVFECMTYGAYARHLHGLNFVEAVSPRMTLSYWWPKQVERFGHDFLERTHTGEFRMVLIQSNTGRTVADFRQLIETAWLEGRAAAGIRSITA